MADPIEITIRALSSESEKVGRVVSLVSQTKRASGLAAVSASNPKGGITKPESGRGTDNGAWKHDKFEEKAAAIASGKRVVVQRPAGDLRNSLISDRVEAIIDAHNSGRAPTAAERSRTHASPVDTCPAAAAWTCINSMTVSEIPRSSGPQRYLVRRFANAATYHAADPPAQRLSSFPRLCLRRGPVARIHQYDRGRCPSPPRLQ